MGLAPPLPGDDLPLPALLVVAERERPVRVVADVDNDRLRMEDLAVGGDTVPVQGAPDGPGGVRAKRLQVLDAGACRRSRRQGSRR